MDLQPRSLIGGFLRAMDRALGGEGARVVAVQLGRQAQRETTTAASDAIVRRDGGPSWFEAQSIEAGRYERTRDLREARVEVPEWDRSLNVKKGYAFSSRVGDGGRPLSFGLTYSGNARREVRTLCDAVTERLDMHAVTPDIYDAGQWLGDSFDELVFDVKSRALVDLRHWEPERVIVRTDRATGRVDHYSVAVGEDYDPTQGIGERVRVDPFLMLHYAPNRVRGQIYGRSMFGSGRKGRREYEAVNDMLVIASLQAIGNQYLLWPFPREQNPDGIWRWVNMVRQGAELNLQFNKDGVLRRRLARIIETSPKVMPYLVDPDLQGKPEPFTAPVANLEHLLRVAQWQQDNNFIVTGVPGFLAGMERNVNAKATATEQSAQFAVAVMADQTDVSQDVIGAIYLRAQLAAGIVPVPGEVKIEMFPPSQLYERQRADVAKVQGEACKVMIEAGLPMAFALKRAFNLGDDEVNDVLGSVETADVASVDAMEEVIVRVVEAVEARYGGRRSVTVDVAAVGAPPVSLPEA